MECSRRNGHPWPSTQPWRNLIYYIRIRIKTYRTTNDSTIFQQPNNNIDRFRLFSKTDLLSFLKRSAVGRTQNSKHTTSTESPTLRTSSTKRTSMNTILHEKKHYVRRKQNPPLLFSLPISLSISPFKTKIREQPMPEENTIKNRGDPTPSWNQNPK